MRNVISFFSHIPFTKKKSHIARNKTFLLSGKIGLHKSL